MRERLLAGERGLSDIWSSAKHAWLDARSGGAGFPTIRSPLAASRQLQKKKRLP
jgi:hypothetical protein